MRRLVILLGIAISAATPPALRAAEPNYVGQGDDWTAAAWKAELSVDGKTWVPWFDQAMTKM